MSYVAGILQPGERVVMLGRLHWIIYINAAVSLAMSLLVFGVAYNYREDPGLMMAIAPTGMLLLVVTGCFAGVAWFDQWITEIAVTNERVIYKRGFIRRQTAEMSMRKIESVIVAQSILGRILDYGSIRVRGTGEGIGHLHKIKAPIGLRNCITAR
jgi:uncharacterized membrane protein YdbT with pleckstrin-like domain